VSEREALIGWFASLGLGSPGSDLRLGASQWLYAAMKQAGLASNSWRRGHFSDAFKAMPVKSDRTTRARSRN